MDISYFLENESKGATYIGRAINDLQISVSEETTILELYSMLNGIYARAIDIMLEEMESGSKII
ncbi:hypothetical protein [Pelotomaculum propionicicum]|uniref:Uncharacterized protein n=1 Tax=Pelotomaculum propionicicum TaxID=258475 RepID=A0A4Y7RM97_9FIRM|nr:hypothetical protein [Pelotomaculum propionicicum]NLI13681.1 hypothetical protein [Peptococcaceae bacterium]TEB09993.1 hypothetical protein Pmgp_02687 [Pelotomaculum propionicicum]